ncbi:MULTISPECIES: RagB/SusD family nutrient uptake outer membrane protein [Niastella]|nr:RagB/SusD family nutrient uptake outer membrane protein [Niastella soli]
MPWKGFYVPALDVPMDLNGDGKNDVCFYKTLPTTQEKGVTYVNVSATLSPNNTANPQRLSNDTYGELTWLNTIKRDWQEKKYVYPVPQADIVINPALDQNPGWK